MSFVPPLVYFGMAPEVEGHILINAIFTRCLPILAAPVAGICIALRLDPLGRPFAAITTLNASIFVALFMMIVGLR
jgi:hypothetical protein